MKACMCECICVYVCVYMYVCMYVRMYVCMFLCMCQLQALSEGLKVVPIAASFSCGSDRALDSSYFQEAALPCLMDVNGDGTCDIHLGVARAIGTNRLCGCSGKDNGGNGRPCDEPADFDDDLGILSIQECIVDADCLNGICVDTKCFLDTQSPYVVSISPSNSSIAVPPVTEVG